MRIKTVSVQEDSFLQAIVVTDVENGSSVDPVCNKQVDAHFSVSSIVFEDVSHKKAISKLVSRERSQNFYVEDLLVNSRVCKSTGIDTELRAQTGRRKNG